MARRRYYRRARRYGRRYTPRARRYARKANSAVGLYNPGIEYLVGAAVGMTEFDNSIPAPIKIIGAALPLKGGMGGKISRFCRGCLLGDAISHYSGVKIPVGLPGNAGSNMNWGSF